MTQQPIGSREFFQWPETRAILKRLGVDVTLPLLSVEIRADCRTRNTEPATVKVEYIAVDAENAPVVVDLRE